MPNPTGPGPKAKADGPAAPFAFGGQLIPPGERCTVDLPLSLLSDHTPLTMSAQVVHGRRPGPCLFLSAGIHGDEINGVEIIRRVLHLAALRRLQGTLIAVPVVNVYGFIGHTRYLPDRRDLNRSFPGSPTGSLAGQLAHLFMTEVVAKCTHGIDLHTGAVHRTNLPQIRANLSNREVRRLALAFGTPVAINATMRDGSLRQAARAARDIPLLVYEGGEALRFEEVPIRAGVKGVVRVMQELGMIRRPRVARHQVKPVMVKATTWTRAPAGGILRSPCAVGVHVSAGDQIGVVADPIGDAEFPVRATTSGIVIGRATLPVVNQGDALFHLAEVSDADIAAETVEQFQTAVERDVLLDEPPVS